MASGRFPRGILLVFLFTLLWPGAAVRSARAATTPFAADSVWNAPLASNAPLDPSSSALVNALLGQFTSAVPWINTTQYSAPVYTVPADQPTVPVHVWGTSAMFTTGLDQLTLNDDLAAVPLPSGARPAAGTDSQLIVWQPSTDRLWEFWQLNKQGDGWHASWGGRIDHVSQSPGYFEPGQFGATATGLSLLGGLIRTSELQSGHIDHALAFVIPHPRIGSVWSLPAQRSDGDNLDPAAIPEGTRFRLDPTLNIDALNLPPVTAMIAKAVQQYGMILRDKGGAVAFYAEDPTPTGTNPYPALFGGASPEQLLARFPWGRLQALKTTLNTPISQASVAVGTSSSSQPAIAGGPAAAQPTVSIAPAATQPTVSVAPAAAQPAPAVVPAAARTGTGPANRIGRSPEHRTSSGCSPHRHARTSMRRGVRCAGARRHRSSRSSTKRSRRRPAHSRPARG